MTWILADEREVIREDSNDTAGMEAWLEWFYMTYLPTRGYTTTKGTVSNDIYYGTRQSWTTKLGTVMQTSQVHEFEITSFDVNIYAWGIDETDATTGLTVKTSSPSSPLLIPLGIFDFQVWESDQDSNSFLVRRKGIATGASDGSNLLAFSLPYSGANNDELATPEYWEAWFSGAQTATGPRYLQPTGRYGNTSGFVTNLVDISGSASYSSYHTHHYAADDMFTKFNRGSSVDYSSPLIFWDESSCEAIQIVGGTDFYLDLNANSSVSILLKTGTVNPEA